jgi:hypothetical protein
VFLIDDDGDLELEFVKHAGAVEIYITAEGSLRSYKPNPKDFNYKISLPEEKGSKSFDLDLGKQYTSRLLFGLFNYGK